MANFEQLYGREVIKPNHHYSTHIAECISDFGPLHGFWTFLFERINKVLKSYNSANHSGGELETSFFREFHRTIQQARVVSHLFLMHALYSLLGQMAKLRANANILFRSSFDLMSYATADDRGTVQALSRELDQTSEDGKVVFLCGSPLRLTHLCRRCSICAFPACSRCFPSGRYLCGGLTAYTIISHLSCARLDYAHSWGCVH